MSQIEAKSKPEAPEGDREAVWTPDPVDRARPRWALRVLRLLISLAVVALAVWLGRAMWNTYMAAPWTRDGTVRAYVVTIAPEVAGRIVQLPVSDNQFVHKGDTLLMIEPTDYTIAAAQAEAAADQARANADNAQREAARREQLTTLETSEEQKQTYQANAIAAMASYRQTVAALSRARVDLDRTTIRSPVNGYVTNLLAQVGDYVNVGQNVISVVDSDSFWVDGYFEEDLLEGIHPGDQATVKLMGYHAPLRGMSPALPAGSRSRTRRRASPASRTSTRSSPGSAWPSGSRCASPSILCRRA